MKLSFLQKCKPNIYYPSVFYKMEVKSKIKKLVSISDYEVKDVLLGVGSFGKVKLARRKKDSRIMCIKTMKKKEIIESKQTDHVINECEIIDQLNHPMIVNFEGFAQDEKFIHIFMEYVPGGELLTHLHSESSFDSHKACFYSAQIIEILSYLHTKEIVYRDLRPENIVIAQDGYIKLIDFGFAKKLKSRTYTICGTPEYLAPEVILNKGHGKPADWWTLGVLLYEMLVGVDPFNDKDPISVCHNILTGKVKYPKNMNPDAKSLIKHLLVSDLSKRYGNLINGVKDIKNHRFIASILFNDLLQKKISAPYKPKVLREDDTSNFNVCEDSFSEAGDIPNFLDPFLNWA